MNQLEAQILVAQGILESGKEILERKTHDYSQGGDAFAAFDFIGVVSDLAIRQGVSGTDLSFVVLLATKLARLISLTGHNATPKNESILDTCTDGANYFALWGAKLTSKKGV